MKKIRLISPLISLFLIILVLAASFGFTLIRHTCFHCGTDETYATISGEEYERSCYCHNSDDQNQTHGSTPPVLCTGCCITDEGNSSHNQGIAEYKVTDDCCSHEAERVVTDELFRAYSQTEIVPYFLVATVIAVIEEAPLTNIRHAAGDKPFHPGRDLTTLFCRIQS